MDILRVYPQFHDLTASNSIELLACCPYSFNFFPKKKREHAGGGAVSPTLRRGFLLSMAASRAVSITSRSSCIESAHTQTPETGRDIGFYSRRVGIRTPWPSPFPRFTSVAAVSFIHLILILSDVLYYMFFMIWSAHVDKRGGKKDIVVGFFSYIFFFSMVCI